MLDGITGFFDTSLLFTIGLVFLVTLVGSSLRSRRKDPCLASFEDFPVTLERTDNKVIWGSLALESTGLELLYQDDVQDEVHLESSYILYGSEYDQIQAIYRYADQLTPELRKKRQRDIERSFHPGLWERSKRGLRAFVGTANESLNEVFGLLVGRVRKPAGRYITDQGATYLNQLGHNLIGHVGGVFDPLLERFVGQKVVVDIQEGDEVHEHVGIFKNYSPDFIELLDVQYPEKRSVTLGAESASAVDCLDAICHANGLTVTNRMAQPLLLHAIDFGDEEELLNVVVNGHESIDLYVKRPCTEATLHLRIIRELDIVVPRTRCVVRHRAERFRTEFLPSIIFDVGILLNPGRKWQQQESQLRLELKENPVSALAAANLGSLLLQRQSYDEARRWLRHALSMRYSLPDNGRAAELQLRELERRCSHPHELSKIVTSTAKQEAAPVNQKQDKTRQTETASSGLETKPFFYV